MREYRCFCGIPEPDFCALAFVMIIEGNFSTFESGVTSGIESFEMTKRQTR